MTARPKDTEDRANVLATRRAELLARLPRKVKGAARLGHADRELVVDDAITYAVLQHARPIADARELERLFWVACDISVKRMLDGRHNTVRNGWKRVGDDELTGVANGNDPSLTVELSEELKLVREFAATLDTQQRRVLRVKYFSGTSEPLGYKKIARQLGITFAAARAADRAIKRKLERFAAVYAAGELCPTRELAISELAAGTADHAQAMLAQAHVEHCRHCHQSYVTQLRAIRSAAFERKVAALLPPVELEDRGRRLRGAWDAVADTLTRPFTHDGAAAAAQLASSGAGRGAGTIALLKIAGACMASAGALGVCATTLVAPALNDDPPARKATSKPARTETRRRRGGSTIGPATAPPTSLRPLPRHRLVRANAPNPNPNAPPARATPSARRARAGTSRRRRHRRPRTPRRPAKANLTRPTNPVLHQRPHRPRPHRARPSSSDPPRRSFP